MLAANRPLLELTEQAKCFVRSSGDRVLHVEVAAALRTAALEVLSGMKWHADNLAPWVVLEDPASGEQLGWPERAERLRREHARRRKVLAEAGMSIGQLVMPELEPEQLGSLAEFGALLQAYEASLVSPLSGLVVVLAPSRVEQPERWGAELAELLADGRLERVRWVVLEEEGKASFGLHEEAHGAPADRGGEGAAESGAAESGAAEPSTAESSTSEPSTSEPSTSEAGATESSLHGSADEQRQPVGPPAGQGAELASPRGATPGPVRSVRCVVDPEDADRELASWLAGVDREAGRCAPPGTVWPRGVQPPERSSAPAPQPIDPVDAERLDEILLAALAAREQRWPDAAAHQEEACVAASRLGRTEEAVLHRLTIGSYCVAAGNLPGAIDHYQRAIDAAHAAAAWKLEAQGQLALGAIHARRGEWELASTHYGAAANAAEAEGEVGTAIEIWRIAGELAMRIDVPEEGLSCWGRALTLAEQHPEAAAASSAEDLARLVAHTRAAQAGGPA